MTLSIPLCAIGGACGGRIGGASGCRARVSGSQWSHMATPANAGNHGGAPVQGSSGFLPSPPLLPPNSSASPLPRKQQHTDANPRPPRAALSSGAPSLQRPPPASHAAAPSHAMCGGRARPPRWSWQLHAVRDQERERLMVVWTRDSAGGGRRGRVGE